MGDNCIPSEIISLDILYVKLINCRAFMRRKIMSTELALMCERKMNYRWSLSFQRFIRISPWKLEITLAVCFII